jgi:hypothetical protein
MSTLSTTMWKGAAGSSWSVQLPLSHAMPYAQDVHTLPWVPHFCHDCWAWATHVLPTQQPSQVPHVDTAPPAPAVPEPAAPPLLTPAVPPAPAVLTPPVPPPVALPLPPLPAAAPPAPLLEKVSELPHALAVASAKVAATAILDIERERADFCHPMRGLSSGREPSASQRSRPARQSGVISRCVKPTASNHASRIGMLPAARSALLASVTMLLGCGGTKAPPAQPPPAQQASSDAPSGDPCHHGATTEEARRCLDRAEAMQHSGESGAAQLAAKVCGGHLDKHDWARCFNLGVMVQ